MTDQNAIETAAKEACRADLREHGIADDENGFVYGDESYDSFDDAVTCMWRSWLPAVRSAIAAYLQHQWRPIADAPKDGTSILISSKNWRTVWRGHYRAAGIAMDSEIERFGEGWTRENYCDSNLQPTHFQPLPEPPKEPK